MRRWLKFGVITFVFLEPFTFALALWDLAHGRLSLHPFKRREAALLELRERARRHTPRMRRAATRRPALMKLPAKGGKVQKAI